MVIELLFDQTFPKLNIQAKSISIMKRLLIFICIILFFIGCESKKNPTESTADNTVKKSTETSLLSAGEISDGWQLLFDGKSKTGWHVYNNKSDGSAWEVTEDGVLHLNPKEILVTPVQGAGDLSRAANGGDLATDEEYNNFHLKLEWKVGNPSNSGIMMFVQEVPEHDNPWQTGPEVQIMHHVDCTEEDNNCVGDLYGLVAGPRDLEIYEDWNSIEIISDNEQLEVLMNGKKLYSIMMWDDNWREMIAKTKFTFWPDFGTYKKGKIVLQDHGHPVWYRNIKIKRL